LPRTIVALGVALLAGFLLATRTRTAAAQEEDGGGESRRAVNEAKEALGAAPPNRDAARRALERATAIDDDVVAVAEAYFRLGFLEEEDGFFESALTNQEACMARAPYSSWARSARQRVHWIAARSEGGFEPLARLQHVRRDPALGSDPAAIEALARDADAFPPGRVRAEARMFVAEALLARMHRPEDAIIEFRKVADDPSSDPTDASLAHRDILQAFLAVGRLDDAVNQVRSFPASNRELAAQVHRLVRRRALRRAAVVELAMFALIVGVGVGSAQARRRQGAVDKAAALSETVLPRWPLAQAGWVLLSGVTMVAAVLLLLDVSGSKYLQVLGL
jgi:tetratricopeptide (TPR) repeat protein